VPEYRVNKRNGVQWWALLLVIALNVFEAMCDHIDYEKLGRLFAPLVPKVPRLARMSSTIDRMERGHAGEEGMPPRSRVALHIGECRLHD
jgi:hypothetical protein